MFVATSVEACPADGLDQSRPTLRSAGAPSVTVRRFYKYCAPLERRRSPFAVSTDIALRWSASYPQSRFRTAVAALSAGRLQLQSLAGGLCLK
jgi:hypothetical protein